LIGRSFAWFGWQQKISIALGVIILITILAPGILGKTNPLNTMTNNVFMKIREAMRRLLFKGHPGSLYGFGLLNGLLPCGMVYLALAGAIATGNAMDGALFMAMFGLGTMPSMAAMSYFGGMMTPGLRQGARKLLPAMMVVVATLLILRGLNLGIPYISPSLNMTSSTAVTCHD
jgi:sulfite exporter TauE/SafE